MQISFRISDKFLKTINVEKNLTVFNEKNQKTISAIFLSLGILSAGFTLFKAVSLNVVPIVLSTLFSVALAALGAYFYQTNRKLNVRKLNKPIYSIQKANFILPVSNSLQLARNKVEHISIAQLQILAVEKKLKNVEIKLLDDSEMVYQVTKVTFLVQQPWKIQMANVVIKKLLVDEERKFAMLVSENCYMIFLKLSSSLLPKIRKKTRVKILESKMTTNVIVSENVKKFASGKHFKSPVTLINFVLRLISEVKILGIIK